MLIVTLDNKQAENQHTPEQRQALCIAWQIDDVLGLAHLECLQPRRPRQKLPQRLPDWKACVFSHDTQAWRAYNYCDCYGTRRPPTPPPHTHTYNRKRMSLEGNSKQRRCLEPTTLPLVTLVFRDFPPKSLSLLMASVILLWAFGSSAHSGRYQRRKERS